MVLTFDRPYPYPYTPGVGNRGKTCNREIHYLRLMRPQRLKRYIVFLSLIFIVHLRLKELSSKSKNIFNNLPTLSAPKKSTLRDKLDRYLSTDPEDVTDALQWWYKHKHTYPNLHHMALNYLSIPGKFTVLSAFFSY
jgi:hypothetical protein